jgi:hypothetical protein
MKGESGSSEAGVLEEGIRRAPGVDRLAPKMRASEMKGEGRRASSSGAGEVFSPFICSGRGDGEHADLCDRR